MAKIKNMPLKKKGEPFEEHISNLHVSITMNISICFSELPIEGKLSDKDIYHNDHNRHPWEIQTMNHVSHNVSGIASLYPSARLLTEILLADETIYHINYGVTQGFPALRKAVTTHVKKYGIFYGE